MWHVSLSYQSAILERPLSLEELHRPARELVEREARKLLAGVGAGRRRWERGERAPYVLHVRRRLSDAEIAMLPPGPPAVDSAGGGPLYCPRTVTP